MINVEQISMHYHMGETTVRALDQVSLSIQQGEYIAITGSSGSGKSTFMNILGCLCSPTDGQYWLNGREVSQLAETDLAEIRNQEIGFVFQNFHLLARTSALDNVMLPLIYRGLAPKTRRELARVALDRVGLGGRFDHHPNQLSGGQRQRVAIARALVGEPALILADEPTGNLDTTTTSEIMTLFDELHTQGHTILMVTHEPEIARRTKRLIQIQDGRIVKDQAIPPINRLVEVG